MADIVKIPASSKNLEMSTKRLMKSLQTAPSPQHIPKKTFNYMKNVVFCGEPSSQMVVFLLKLAALEIVRRISRRNCPAVWQVLQAMQLFTCPPLKWIRRWAPLKNLVKGLQVISRPLLCLSVATAISDHSESSKKNSKDVGNSQPCSDSCTNPTNSRKRVSDETSESIVAVKEESLLMQIHKELKTHEIVLPERINNDELQRFHTAANGDFACLLQSVKKTISWRENYQFFSKEELEIWSHLVFWHGTDIKNRPCLIIRLGLACSSIAHWERSNFTKVIVSQIEHGILSLVNCDDPRISVLMDCEGLSPFRFPTQMLRSCSTLMQDHYPEHLAALLIIRLPSVTRVIAQTFIKVLKPTTKKKLRFEGDMYKKVLPEFLEPVPLFLGGNCTCARCLIPTREKQILDTNIYVSHEKTSANEGPVLAANTLSFCGNYIIKVMMVGSFIMFWIFIVAAHRAI